MHNGPIGMITHVEWLT